MAKLEDIVQPLPQSKEVDRLTLVTTINHEHRGDQPHSVDCRSSILLQTNDEAYSGRKLEVADCWKAIDLGWLSDTAGYISIENSEGKHFTLQPSPEEREDIAKRIVEVSFRNPPQACVLVHPGMIQFCLPVAPSIVQLRCQHGKAKCRVTVFPR